MKTIRILAFALAILYCVSALPVLAQQKAPARVPAKKEEPVKKVLADEEFFPKLRADEEIPYERLERRPFTLSYGGWITPTLIHEEKSDSSSTSSNTARLWVKSTLWQNAFIYARGKYTFTWNFDKPSGSSLDTTDHVYDLDVAYIGMANRYQNMKLFVGRKFYILGTGLVFSGRGDGIEVSWDNPIVSVKAFGAYTGFLAKDSNPYKLSDRDISKGSKRIFAGGTLEKDFFNQTAYVLGMAQIDNGRQEMNVKSRYQSQYYGAGFKGLIIDGLDYYAEGVYERGFSYFKGSEDEKALDRQLNGTSSNPNMLKNHKKEVSAYAAMAGVNYYLPTILNPAILFQYAFGSGDGDRQNYSSSTGNTRGADTGFIYFGTYVGGFALRPLLANLHIFRLGFSLAPMSFMKQKFLNRMSVVLRYSYYMKSKIGSPINYGEAPDHSSDVGHGADAALRWGIFDDLSFFVNYGLFITGDAYSSSGKTRHFILGGFNLVF